jgi:hypothetical protein
MINLAKLSSLRIVGLAAGAAAVSGAVVLVTASAAGYSVPFFNASHPGAAANTASLDPQAAAPSALCFFFNDPSTTEIYTSQAALNAAFQKAIGETLADQVKNGKLTQARADAIKARLAGRTPCAIAGALKGRAAGPKLGAYRQALLSAAASALGITDATLKSDLGKGMTLSQIAAAQNVTEAQFRTKLIAILTPLLDKAVAGKMLTPTQESRIIKRLQTGTIPLWNKPARPTASAGATPSATP